MRTNLVRKAAIGLAAVAGSLGLSMTAPVVAHAAEQTTTVQTLENTTLSQSGTVDGGTLYARKTVIGVISADQGDGCVQYTYFYSDGSKAIVYRCLIIVRA